MIKNKENPLEELETAYLDSFKNCAGKVRQALEDEVPNLFQLASEVEDEGPVLSM